MKIINRTRCSGKTTMLISAAYTNNCPIICSTEKRKEYILNMAKQLDCNINVFTSNEFRRYRNAFDEVYIDEAKDFIEDALEQMMGCKIKAITMTVPIEGKPYLLKKENTNEDTN